SVISLRPSSLGISPASLSALALTRTITRMPSSLGWNFGLLSTASNEASQNRHGLRAVLADTPNPGSAQPRKYFSGPVIFHVPPRFWSSMAEGAAVTPCATTVARSPCSATLLMVPPSVDGLWVAMALMHPFMLWNSAVTSVFDR